MDGCSHSKEDSIVESLRYVACISYPRSGHNLTEWLLKQYFQDRFTYCEFYTPSSVNCCKAFPCANPKVSMSKNHDFGLYAPEHFKVPKVSGVPYLVIYRNFLEAVVSDYEKRCTIHPDKADTLHEWHAFSKQKLTHYQRFVKKWAIDEDRLEKLVIRYEDLTGNPLVSYRMIVSFCEPSVSPDLLRLQQLIDEAALVVPGSNKTMVHIANSGIRDRRTLEDFKYFDAKYFAYLESRLSYELLRLGYHLRFATGISRGRRFRLPGFS